MREPSEVMRQVRRAEILLGAMLIVAGLTVGPSGALRWLIVGCGLIALLPISGAAAILRRTERKSRSSSEDAE